MYQITCERCGEPLAPERLDSCEVCTWSAGPKTRTSETIGPDDSVDVKSQEGATRRKRKKRSRARVPVAAPRLSIDLGPLTAYAGLVLLWIALAVLSWLAPAFVPWLIAYGAITTTIGAVWCLAAAQRDGIELWTISSRGFIALAITWLIQMLVIPLVSLFHLATNFEGAWRPATTLVLGLVITTSGVFLLR